MRGVFVTPRDIRRFYGSGAWRNLRAVTIAKRGKRCERCGVTKGQFHVDHVVPIWVSWASRLDPQNLEVLCRRCHVSEKKREENLK